MHAIPALFNVFFSAIVLVALKGFGEDAETLAGHAYPQGQPLKVDPQTALECARRVIWGILYPDNACIASPRRAGRSGWWRSSSKFLAHLVWPSLRSRQSLNRFRGNITARQSVSSPIIIEERKSQKPQTYRPRLAGKSVRVYEF